MEEFRIGDTIQFTNTIKLRCVLQAKKGQNGIIENIENNKVLVKLTNNNIVETIIDNIESYKKKDKFNINTASNEELLEKFEFIVAYEYQTINTHTKTFEKILKDKGRVQEELLIRLNRKG